MYAIYAYIDPPNHPNVGKYGIHGASGKHHSISRTKDYRRLSTNWLKRRACGHVVCVSRSINLLTHRTNIENLETAQVRCGGVSPSELDIVFRPAQVNLTLTPWKFRLQAVQLRALQEWDT